MAGRRHHYIPRLLQKGFCIEPARPNALEVYLFRRGHAPHLVGINQSFVEKDFYGRSGNSDVDDLITGTESDLSLFVESIRTLTATSHLGVNLSAARMIWQMGLRTNWFRHQHQWIGKVILAKILKELHENDKFAAEMKEAMPARMAELLADIKSEMAKGVDGVLTGEERTLFAFLEEEKEARPELFSQTVRTLDFRFSMAEIDDLLKEAVPRAHNHLLKEHLESREPGLRQRLESLAWSVVVDDSSKLILGDCGPITIGDGGKTQAPIGVWPSNECRAIAMAISPSHYLLGRGPAPFSGPSQFDLNRCTAAWSQAFIANTLEPSDPRLHELAGTASDLYVAKAVVQGLAEIGIRADFSFDS